MSMVAVARSALPWTVPAAETDGAEPLACAFALPDSHEPPSAATSAVFAVEKNNCRRFMLIPNVLR
jgi:hypothetical protein